MSRSLPSRRVVKSSRDFRRPLVEGLESRQLLSGVVITPVSVPPNIPVAPVILPNQAVATLTAVNFNAVAGKQFDGTVATYTIPLPVPVTASTGSTTVLTGPFTGTINWGDGTTSSATILYTPSVGALILVDGKHTYALAGKYTTTITLTQSPVVNPGGPIIFAATTKATTTTPLTLSATGTATVTGNTAGGVTIYPIVDKPFKQVTVAKLNFRVPATSAPAVYAATISWGDGTTSAGTFVDPSAAGNTDVADSHTYTKPGVFNIVVTVTYSPGGPGTLIKILAQIGSTAIVDAMPPTLGTGTGVTLDLTAGQSFTGSVGSFTAGLVAISSSASTTITPPEGYVASISWGDGKTSSGTIMSNGKGGYNVIGTHTYAKPGTYTIDVGVLYYPIVPPGGPVPEFIALIASWQSTAKVSAAVST